MRAQGLVTFQEVTCFFGEQKLPQKWHLQKCNITVHFLRPLQISEGPTLNVTYILKVLIVWVFD